MAVQIHLDYPANTREGNTCSACHAGHRQLRDTTTGELRPEQIVDFFINIDFEGFLMLCEQCVLEAAAMLGWVSPGQRDVAIDAAAGLVVENGMLRAERDEAKLLVRLIRDYDHEVVPTVEPVDQPESAIDGDSVLDVVQPVDQPVRKTKARAAKATA